jgi:murein DD-endopeptidase MepM/ murein hydrolase activator NlpD
MLNFEALLKKTSSAFTSVLAISDQHSDYIPIDLSVNNHELAKQLHSESKSEDWENYIDQFLRTNKKKVAYGGYLEHRFLYERSAYFTQEENENKRNRHLGIDLWCPAQTGVLAPLDGIVHSFGNNKNHGDYGPTIILEHHIENIKFYTLYGHLSLESIQAIELSDFIKKGQEFAQLGTSRVNGDYAPHLHFQLIKDLGDYLGDYPGVCTVKELDYYKTNCPDPNFLLKFTQ